jgi:hypothetical protein
LICFVGSTRGARVICDASSRIPKDVRREGASNGTRGRVRSPNLFVRPNPMFVHQTSGHFSREVRKVNVRYYRYFLVKTQQKAQNPNFHKKCFSRPAAPKPCTLRSIPTKDGWRRRVSQQKAGKANFRKKSFFRSNIILRPVGPASM